MTPPEDRFADLPGSVRLHYRDWGGEGTPLLLLHGLASSCRIWDWTAPVLAERFRVIAADQRGHGLSDKPGEYGFDVVAGDALQLIEMIGLERPVVVGHSWGASVALHLAVSRPAFLRGVVLVDGAFVDFAAHRTWDEAEREMRPPEVDGTPVDRFVNVVRQFPAFASVWNDEFEEMFLSNFEVREARVYRRLPVPDHMLIARAIYDQKPMDLFARLSVPALAIPALTSGETEIEQRFRTFKEDGIARMRNAAPAVEVRSMEDTIHDVPVQRPRELAEIISGFAEGLA